MNAFEEYLNSLKDNSGTEMRKNNPDDFAVKYAEWVARMDEKNKDKNEIEI